MTHKEQKTVHKIALMENFNADFYMFRLPFVKFLRDKGYTVTAIVPPGEYSTKIEESGFHVFEYNLKRNSLNPLATLNLIFSLASYFRKEKFDLLHTFRLQPNIIGTLAAKLAGIPVVINHVTGLGFAFADESIKARIFRLIFYLIYQFVFIFSKKVIVQNPEDIDVLSKLLFNTTKKFQLIKGSGLNADVFSPDNVDKNIISELKSDLNLTDDNIVVSIITRLIWEKGIAELVETATCLIPRYPHLRFLIVGWSDPENPAHIPNSYIQKHHSKHLQFLGKRSDIKELLSITDIFALPSFYREGLPRSVLEAMAMQKTIVTTNMPGCNLTVEHGVNGFLILPKDVNSLTQAIEHLIQDKNQLQKMGLKSRQKFIQEFSDQVVYEQILEIYQAYLK